MSAIPIPTPTPQAGQRTRVLVVDDSAVVREVISRALSACPDIEVVGTAPDPFVAREKILKLNPDVITLDVEMPRMDGITFLEKLMAARPMPVIIISSLTTQGAATSVRALQAGAVDVLHKPSPMDPPEHLNTELPAKIRSAAKAKVTARHVSTMRIVKSENGAPAAPATSSTQAATSSNQDHQVEVVQISPPWKRLIAVGASTGGVQALTAFLTQFPKDCPPTLVVQHMPARFTGSFAERLHELCQCDVAEAREGDILRQGLVLLAPGGRHMTIRRAGTQLTVALKDGPPVFHQKPAVEVMFDSVTRLGAQTSVGVILTGMGADGAAALLRMRQGGARTFAEDASTAIVYGMPAEAAKLGAAEKIMPLYDMPRAVLNAAKV